MAPANICNRFVALLGFGLFSLLLFIPFVSLAQEGVSIQPAVLEETLAPGVFKEYDVTVRNLNSSEQTFFLSTRNIADVSDGGVPIFARDDGEITGFELVDWITLPVNEITLAGGASERITFILEVPENASPGSHFGGIFVSVDPPDLQTSGAAVGYQVANIVSIRVAGDAIESANIRQFSTNRFLYGSQNVDFSVRIENGGNVLVRPVGPLEVYNMLGQKVDTIVFNESAKSVFPGKVRDFEISWEGTGVGFGRYEAVISPIYGDEGAKKTMSSTASFWVLPMSIIGPALGVLAVVLLVTFVAVQLYIRRALAHVSHGRTRIIRKRRSNSSATLLLIIVMLVVTALFLIVLLALFA